MPADAPVVIDCHNHVGIELLLYLRGEFPYAQTLTQMVEQGGVAGVTHWVVFPMVTNLTMDAAALREGRIEPGGLESVPYAWENRRLLHEIYELFPETAPRVFPFMMLDPHRSPGPQIEALRKLRSEYKFYGLKMQTTMIQAPVKSLLDTGRGFLELAEEWDLPLLLHSSVYAEDPWAQASDILDVAEASPRNRFCVAHSCRFDREQLDRIAALPHVWFDCSAHVIHCQLAEMESPHVAPPARRFQSDFSRPAVVLRDLADAYPGKLIWGSDSPYYSYVASDLRLVTTYAEETACVYALPAELRDRVAHQNTRACFRLPEIASC